MSSSNCDLFFCSFLSFFSFFLSLAECASLCHTHCTHTYTHSPPPISFQPHTRQCQPFSSFAFPFLRLRFKGSRPRPWRDRACLWLSAARCSLRPHCSPPQSRPAVSGLEWKPGRGAPLSHVILQALSLTRTMYDTHTYTSTHTLTHTCIDTDPLSPPSRPTHFHPLTFQSHRHPRAPLSPPHTLRLSPRSPPTLTHILNPHPFQPPHLQPKAQTGPACPSSRQRCARSG